MLFLDIKFTLLLKSKYVRGLQSKRHGGQIIMITKHALEN